MEHLRVGLLGYGLGCRWWSPARREELPEMRALVSSLNAGSLELHRASGFDVRYRPFQWQLAR